MRMERPEQMQRRTEMRTQLPRLLQSLPQLHPQAPLLLLLLLMQAHPQALLLLMPLHPLLQLPQPHLLHQAASRSLLRTKARARLLRVCWLR